MGRRGKKKFQYPKRPPPPWTELPRDLTENILRRLGPVDILENAQKVCTTWRSVCKEPSMWRVIDLKNYVEHYEMFRFINSICRRAVDLSQGELINISINYFGSDELLHYISQRSSHLKCLRLGHCNYISSEGLTTSVKNFPELEELHLTLILRVTANALEGINISCPKLKSFTFYGCSYKYEVLEIDDSWTLTISKNIPNLQHLCLIGNKLRNEGLEAILNGCPNLESLDQRQFRRGFW